VYAREEAALRPVLLFDVMGTLVYEPFFVEVPAFFGMSLEQLLVAKHPTAWAEFERGEIDEKTLAAIYFKDGRPFDYAELKSCMTKAYSWLDGMNELLVELREAEFSMHALSNYPVWYRWIEERLKLSRYLEWSFVSCHTGVRKPDPEAFLVAAQELAVDPRGCIFVDDRPENCHAARKVGMDAITFHDAKRLRSEFVARGLLRSLG
jgi:HAD superfamily hydrolase (TIGR01509 family)